MLSDTRDSPLHHDEKRSDLDYTDDFDENTQSIGRDEKVEKDVTSNTSMGSAPQSHRNASRNDSERSYPIEGSKHSSRDLSIVSPTEDSSVQRDVRGEEGLSPESGRRSDTMKSSTSPPEKRTELSSNLSSKRNSDLSHHCDSKKSASALMAGKAESHKWSELEAAAAQEYAVSADAKGAAAKSNGDDSAPKTKEDLLDLLRRNDDLNLQLLNLEQSERIQKSSRGVEVSPESANSTHTSAHNQKKSVETIQHSLHREGKRRFLRKERNFLISQRTELQMRVARNKQLSRYPKFIETLRKDIAKLYVEKRALSLEIRRNEKILLNNEENQDSDDATKRLADTIRADDVLTKRALYRARCDALDTTKTCLVKKEQISALEEKLESVWNKQFELLDGDLKELLLQYRKQLEKSLRMKQRLCTLKRGISVSKAEKNAHLNDEHEFLSESVDRMEKEMDVIMEGRRERLILLDEFDAADTLPKTSLEDRPRSSGSKPKSKQNSFNADLTSASNHHKMYSDTSMSEKRKLDKDHSEERQLEQEQQPQQQQQRVVEDAASYRSVNSDRGSTQPVSTGEPFRPVALHKRFSDNSGTKVSETAPEAVPEASPESNQESRRSGDGMQQDRSRSPDASNGGAAPPRYEWEEGSQDKDAEHVSDTAENQDVVASNKLESAQASTKEGASAEQKAKAEVPSWIDDDDEQQSMPEEAVEEDAYEDEAAYEASEEFEEATASAKDGEEEEEKEEGEKADAEKVGGNGEPEPSWLDFD